MKKQIKLERKICYFISIYIIFLCLVVCRAHSAESDQKKDYLFIIDTSLSMSDQIKKVVDTVTHDVLENPDDFFQDSDTISIWSFKKEVQRDRIPKIYYERSAKTRISEEISKVMRYLQHDIGGGTNIGVAIKESLERMKNSPSICIYMYSDGEDTISPGEIWKLKKIYKESYEEKHKKGAYSFKYVSLGVMPSDSVAEALRAIGADVIEVTKKDKIPGVQQMTIKPTKVAINAKVKIQPSYVDFGDINAGETSRSTINIQSNEAAKGQTLQAVLSNGATMPETIPIPNDVSVEIENRPENRFTLNGDTEKIIVKLTSSGSIKSKRYAGEITFRSQTPDLTIEPQTIIVTFRIRPQDKVAGE